MSKILIVDDDSTLLQLLKSSLQLHGFDVTATESGAEALRAAFQLHPDLIILDVMMPGENGLDGIEVCKRLRDMSDIPIIMLTALSQESDVVKGLNAGADDYIKKPYSIAELVARIQAQLRPKNHRADSVKSSTLRVGDVSIDLPKRKVTVRGQEVKLTPTEYDLLVFLARHRDVVVSHRKLLNEGWGPEYVDQLDYLRLYIRYLRCKIEKDPGNPRIIKTERGVGYYMDSTVWTEH